MLDPIPITRSVAIPMREVVVRASRSSGPGGQHANVTASRIEVSFDVGASASLSDAQKARLATALAVQRPRQKTRPTAGSKKRRLEGKRRNAERKRGRSRPSFDE